MGCISNEDLNKYKREFRNFDNFLQKVNSNQYQYPNGSNILQGYIINYEEYKELRDKILSENENNMSHVRDIKQIFFEKSSYLINMISNGNKYIIINKDLLNAICSNNRKEDIFFNYIIENNYLILKLDKDIYFINNKNNIIGKDYISYFHILNYSSNFEEIEKIYKGIKLYNDFENNFLTDLKSSTKKQNEGYLVNKDWFDEWEKYTNYQIIKKNFLEKKKK